MIEFAQGIAVMRDLVIIFSLAVITGTVVRVSRVTLDVTRKADNMLTVVGAAVTAVASPIRGLFLAIGRRPRR